MEVGTKNLKPPYNESDMPKEINLFRIPDDVSEEILRALDFWLNHSPTKIYALTDRAIKDLKYPYSKVTFDENNKPSTIDVIPSIEAKKEELVSTSLNNGLLAFKNHLENLQRTSTTDKETITKILNLFEKIVGTQI